MSLKCICLCLGKTINFYNPNCPNYKHQVEYYRNEIEQIKKHLDLLLKRILIHRNQPSRVH